MAGPAAVPELQAQGPGQGGAVQDRAGYRRPRAAAHRALWGLPVRLPDRRCVPICAVA
jgi:hypothetical protein